MKEIAIFRHHWFISDMNGMYIRPFVGLCNPKILMIFFKSFTYVKIRIYFWKKGQGNGLFSEFIRHLYFFMNKKRSERKRLTTICNRLQ